MFPYSKSQMYHLIYVKVVEPGWNLGQIDGITVMTPGVLLIIYPLF